MLLTWGEYVLLRTNIRSCDVTGTLFQNGQERHVSSGHHVPVLYIYRVREGRLIRK